MLYENHSAIQKYPLGLDFCLIVGQDKNELTIIGVLPTFSDAAHTLLRNQSRWISTLACCAWITRYTTSLDFHTSRHRNKPVPMFYPSPASC